MLLECTVFPSRAQIEKQSGRSCVNWSVFFCKFFDEITWGKVTSSIQTVSQSIHVYCAIEFEGKKRMVDIFHETPIKEFSSIVSSNEAQSMDISRVKEVVSKPKIHVIRYVRWKKIELEITTLDEYDRLTIQIHYWPHKWSSKRVLMTVLEQIQLSPPINGWGAFFTNSRKEAYFRRYRFCIWKYLKNSDTSWAERFFKYMRII